MRQEIIDRLKEPSTWRGVCLTLTAAGVALDPEQENLIIVAGLLIAGLIGMLTRDRK